MAKVAKQSKAAKATLSSMLSARITNLMPTIALRIIQEEKLHTVRLLLDQCAPVSRITWALVEQLQLPTVRIDGHSICSVKVRPMAGQEKAVELTLRVNDRIDIVTPTDMLDETVAARYSNMILADKDFYVSRPVSIILGANVYSRIIQECIIMAGRPVLPQNSIFGWLISGLCIS